MVDALSIVAIAAVTSAIALPIIKQDNKVKPVLWTSVPQDKKPSWTRKNNKIYLSS